jgi:hypothetical protein
MREAVLLWLPLLGVAVFGIIGAAPAAVLGARFPTDAKAALAVLLGMAAMVCLSPLLLIGVAPLALGLLLVVTGGGAALYKWAESLRLLRAALLPATLAAGAVLLIATPWLAHGAWDAASYGNADTYLWVSEAKAFLDGPPAMGMPDRQAFEMIESLRMPIGIPTGVALTSIVAGTDPEASAGGFFVLVGVAVALATFVCARGVLGLGSAASAAAALLVGGNTFLVFSGYYGWHGQLLLTAFGTLSVFCVGAALKDGADWRERALSGIFGAAALGTYGLVFSFFVAMAGSVLVAQMLFSPSRGPELARTVRVARGCILALVAAGAVPIVRAIIAIPELSKLATTIEDHPRGLVSEALGLAPRAGDLSRLTSAWGLIALAAAVALVALALLGGRLLEFENRAVVVGAGGFALLAGAFMMLPQTSSYGSVKLMGYGAPALTLLVFTGLVRTSRRRLRLWLCSAAALLFLASSAVSVVQSHRVLEWSSDFDGLRDAARGVPRDEPIAIAPRQAWQQTWAAYFLRDRPTLIVAPSIYFTRFGTHPFEQASTRPVTFVFEHAGRDGGQPLWARGEFVLHSVSDQRGSALRSSVPRTTG